MNFRVNGEDFSTDKELTILEFIEKEKRLDTKGIVIEYNGKVLKKEEWDKTYLKDGDNLEIVSFVGGG